MNGDKERFLGVVCDACIDKPISVHHFPDAFNRFPGTAA